MHQNLKTKIRAIFLAILPGILIGLFVLSANIYYDIDLQKWITEGVQKILGQLQTTATTTLAILEGRVGIGTELPLYKLDVSGNVRLGNASSSEIVFEGYIQSGIIPYYDAFYNLGSQNFRWANLYTNELTVSSSSTLGTVISGIWQASPIEISYGGTGLTFLGQANQILGVKADQSSLEYKNITSLLQAGQGISIQGEQVATISNTGVLSLNSLTGILNLQGTPNQIFISTSPNTISFSLPQDIATSSSPTFFTLNLTSPLLVSSGGTGLSSVASGALLYGSGSGVLNVLPIGQAGQILVSTGSQPNWQSLSSLSILTGQGAQNYLAKWTDNLSLATTTIYEANEKVGIGTTNPNYTLTVNGDLYVSATSTLGSATSSPVIFGGYIQSNVIPFSDATYTLGAPSFRWANLYAATTTIGGTIIIGSQTIEGTATTTLFTSGNPNQLVLGANGLVGIGTMAPSQKLTVAGNIGIQAGANAFVGTLDNYALSLRTNNTDRIFITNDGNVGIGTTTPAYKLTVSGDVAVSQNIYLSTSSLIYIGTNSGSSGQFLRRTATGLDWSEPLAVIPWPLRAPAGEEGTPSAPAYSFELYPATGMFLATSTGSLAFSASSTQVLTLTPSGNVGIGTTNPSYRLDVAGVIRGQDNLYITGNVGIGTTAPSFKLDVQGGDINVSANLRTGGTIRLDSSGNLSNIGTISSTYLTTGASYVNVAGASTVFQMQGTTIITSGRALQNLTGISSSGTITFTGLTANRLVATDASSNLVTTISSANLAASVTDETGTGLLVFNTSPTFSTQITTPLIYGSSAASGNLTLRSTSDATKGYIILADDGGNVGIGTATPASKLHVIQSTGSNAIRINDFIFRPLSSTELALLDTVGDQIIIFDQLSSPIIWSQQLSSEFLNGTFENTTTSEEKIFLEKNREGKYMSSGTYTSSIYDYGFEVYFLHFRASVENPISTRILATLQVSDDNFSSIKDEITFELTGEGTLTFPLDVLSHAKQVRAKFIFLTEDPNLTPILHDFEIWADFVTPPKEKTEISNIQDSSIGEQISSTTEKQIPSTTEEKSFLSFYSNPFEEITSILKEGLNKLGMIIEEGVVRIKKLFTKEIIVENITGDTLIIKQICSPEGKCLKVTNEVIEKIEKIINNEIPTLQLTPAPISVNEEKVTFEETENSNSSTQDLFTQDLIPSEQTFSSSSSEEMENQP